MKIFDEYSNMLRCTYSIRIRSRGILNLINQYHLWTRGVATVLQFDILTTLSAVRMTRCPLSLKFLACAPPRSPKHGLYSHWHVFLPIFISNFGPWKSCGPPSKKQASGGQGRREEEMCHIKAGEIGHITSHHIGKGRSITCDVTTLPRERDDCI